MNAFLENEVFPEAGRQSGAEQSKGAVTLWLPQFITNGRGLEICASLAFKVMINEVWLGW